MSEKTGCVLLSDAEAKKWKARQKKLELGGKPKLTGLFRGWIPEGYFTSGEPRILYVGKATSGSFGGSEPEREYFNGKGAFWHFARQIAAGVRCDDGSIPCIAWSNISKISYPKVKAERSLIDGFEKESAQTLRSEIAKAKPHLIVFVTARFGEKVVRMVSDGEEDREWNKSENESHHKGEWDVWWKCRRDGIAVLWMRHPMGATKQKKAYAAAKISSLTCAEHNPEVVILSDASD